MLDWMCIPLSDGSISMNHLPPNWNDSAKFSERIQALNAADWTPEDDAP